MTEKSHVSMEQQVCIVCCKAYDTNAILLHKQLRPVLDRHTVTGWGMCPEHQKLKDEGYVALIEIDEAKSTPSVGHNPHGQIQPNDAYRLGRVVHVRVSAWDNIFKGQPVPLHRVTFVESAVVDMLEKLQQKST
jgi:hypothetical protein